MKKARAPPEGKTGYLVLVLAKQGLHITGGGGRRSNAAAERGERMRYIVIAYEAESPEAAAEYRQSRRRQRQRERHRRQRRLYFLKQRLCGVVLIALTALTIRLLDGDATIALVLIPIALMLIFSKEMCITNEFYWKEQERK